MATSRPWLVTDSDHAAEPWDQYGLWEAWVRRHIPEAFVDAWDNLDGNMKVNLYAVMAGLADAGAERIAQLEAAAAHVQRWMEAAETERGRVLQFRGYVADLQRHIRVAVEEDATRIPPGVLCVVGAMSKVCVKE